MDKVNAELVTLTYGTIVAQLCKDYESDYVEVNKQLDKMGYNIGLRLIEDYLAKSNTMRRCSNFRETAEMIAKVDTALCVLRYGERWTDEHMLGWIQDLPQHHTDSHELDERQQAILPNLRRESPSGLCGAPRRRTGTGRAMVLQYLLRGLEGCFGDGTDAGGGAFHHRCIEGQ